MKDYWYDKVEVSIFLCNKDDAAVDPDCASGAVTPPAGPDPGRPAASCPRSSRSTTSPRTRRTSAQGAVPRLRARQQRHRRTDAGVVPGQAQGPEKYQVVARRRRRARPASQRSRTRRTSSTTSSACSTAARSALWWWRIVMLGRRHAADRQHVRVSAFSRRRETGIMRLVGASNLYIQLPFILEAAVAGLDRRGCVAAWCFALVDLIIDRTSCPATSGSPTSSAGHASGRHGFR